MRIGRPTTPSRRPRPVLRRPVRAVAVAAGLAVVLGLTTTPGSADPADDTAAAREKVEQAHNRAEQALERYLAITDELKDSRADVAAVKRDVERQQKVYDRVRADLGATIADQLTDSPMGPTAQLVGSEDPQSFLDGLAAVQSYNSNQADRLESFGQQARQLKVRRTQLRAKTRSIEVARTKLRREKDTLDRRARDAEATLASLTAAQRAAVDAADDAASSSSEEPPPVGSVDASGKAKKAIDFALAQLGDPYSYGGTGPDSWDCSGLVGGAWGSAGVSLPRSSSAQSGSGSAVSRSDMSPGDLVFYYSPVSHVGIYLGDGRLVHAPRSGRNVEVVSVDSMPINSVRRVG